MTPSQFTALAEAVANKSRDPRVHLEYHDAIRRHIHSWHLPMLRDENRNQFYASMIQTHVRGKTVLEIGTGTGMIALLAAEAGAKHVYTVEANPVLGSIAKANIEASAHAEDITLFFKHSGKLKLPEKVDIVISEIIATDVFSEEMLTTLKDARRFLKPDGKFLPSKIEVYAALVSSSRQPSEENFLTELIATYSTHVTQMVSGGFELVSKPKKITEIDGFELTKPSPWTFTLKRERASDATDICFFFVVKEGKSSLTNFIPQDTDPVDRLYANSWQQMLWPLEQKETYKITAHLMNESQIIVLES